MTVEELISQLSKYDRSLSVVIVDEYGKPFSVSYCSPQMLSDDETYFLCLEEIEESDKLVLMTKLQELKLLAFNRSF